MFFTQKENVSLNINWILKKFTQILQSVFFFLGRTLEQLLQHIRVGFFGGHYSVTLKNGETKECKSEGVTKYHIQKQIHHAFKELQKFGQYEFGDDFDLTRFWTAESGT